jgi:hypothetical protein
MRRTTLMLFVLTVALSLVTASLVGKVAYGADSSSAIPGFDLRGATPTTTKHTNNRK